MQYLTNHASALRCIGQALQNRDIQTFELKNDAGEFRLHYGDPNPPYIALLELRFSIDDIKILDREGQARRGEPSAEIRFDSFSEILRAVGEYIDNKHGNLRRVSNSSFSNFDGSVLESEYETRTGDVISETLAMRFIREVAVTMYKRRTRLSNPIRILTR